MELIIRGKGGGEGKVAAISEESQRKKKGKKGGAGWTEEIRRGTVSGGEMRSAGGATVGFIEHT